MALDGDARQHEIYLIVVVAISSQVLDHTQTGLAIGDRGIQVMLLAVLIDREALLGRINCGRSERETELVTYKIDHAAGTKLWLDRAGDKNRRLASLHAKLGLAILDDIELDGDDPSNFDGTAKRNLAITLREVKITDGKLGAFDVDGQIHLASSAEILDITWGGGICKLGTSQVNVDVLTISAMLRTARNGACTFLAHLLFDVTAGTTRVYALRLRWLRNDPFERRSADQLGFTSIPFGEDLG